MHAAVAEFHRGQMLGAVPPLDELYAALDRSWQSAGFLSRSHEAFTEFIGSAISDLSALVMAAFLSELSAKLLNLTGLLALLFAALAFGFWLASNRRKVRGRNSLN